MASLSCRATPCSRAESPRGVGCEIRSIWRVMESSRWWMSATSRAGEEGGAGFLKLGGADSPSVELSHSFIDIPARRAAASALSRTVGSMPSTLHDTREFMLLSGSLRRPHLAPAASPRVPVEENLQFRAGRLPQTPTFSL